MTSIQLDSKAMFGEEEGIGEERDRGLRRRPGMQFNAMLDLKKVWTSSIWMPTSYCKNGEHRVWWIWRGKLGAMAGATSLTASVSVSVT